MGHSLAPPDAIVVLGCRVEPSGDLSPTLTRRAAWARAAFEAKLGRYVVPSGGRRWGDHVEAEQLSRWLARGGVPSDAIFAERLSLTTAENAVFSAEVLTRLRVRRAVIVTCAWHMQRALACFRRAGVDALPLPVPAAPSTLFARLYRSGHEIVSSRLDAMTMERIRRVRATRGSHPFDERISTAARGMEGTS
ncbi:MAG: YdcF family protein [Polyangiaceae bacterium]|nr:YdcF family protein [Polyangiaceae bacterium]